MHAPSAALLRLCAGGLRRPGGAAGGAGRAELRDQDAGCARRGAAGLPPCVAACRAPSGAVARGRARAAAHPARTLGCPAAVPALGGACRHAPPGGGSRAGPGHLCHCGAPRPHQAALQASGPAGLVGRGAWTGARAQQLPCMARWRARPRSMHSAPLACPAAAAWPGRRLQVPATPGEAQLEFTIGEEGAFVLTVKASGQGVCSCTQRAGLAECLLRCCPLEASS